MPTIMTEDEAAVLESLADAWNGFVKLERLHPDEASEFKSAIHHAQTIIMSRPVQRGFNEECKTESIDPDKELKSLLIQERRGLITLAEAIERRMAIIMNRPDNHPK